MEQKNEYRQQRKAEYLTPEIEFAGINPVWCDGSYDPLKGENETPIIFM